MRFGFILQSLAAFVSCLIGLGIQPSEANQLAGRDTSNTNVILSGILPEARSLSGQLGEEVKTRIKRRVSGGRNRGGSLQKWGMQGSLNRRGNMRSGRRRGGMNGGKFAKGGTNAFVGSKQITFNLLSSS